MADAPVLYPYLPLMPRAYSLSSVVRMGVYDCLYVALAEREGCDFVTADSRLVSNLGKMFTFITSLSALP
jgi:predicted nucleic acid-binding protein